jgi:hypothetical protein
MKSITVTELRQAVQNQPARSAWDKGVKEYALELLNDVTDKQLEECASRVSLRKLLLNGADTWQEYSYGGCSLIYDGDIAERLCSPSGLKRCNGGSWAPNRNKTWLDVQARALRQAFGLVADTLVQAMYKVTLKSI